MESEAQLLAGYPDCFDKTEICCAYGAWPVLISLQTISCSELLFISLPQCVWSARGAELMSKHWRHLLMPNDSIIEGLRDFEGGFLVLGVAVCIKQG